MDSRLVLFLSLKGQNNGPNEVMVPSTRLGLDSKLMDTHNGMYDMEVLE